MSYSGSIALLCVFFFFKQKTAYEMRISDWSSDVCSSDLAEESPGWRAMGQVSLGEILASPNEAAFFAVNSKRVDLLIVDADCRPLHAVETQGQGHHQSDNTAARDAVKRGDRKRVVKGKSVSARVDLGGRRMIKQKNGVYKSIALYICLYLYRLIIK